MSKLSVCVLGLIFSIACHGADCSALLVENKLIALRTPLLVAQEDIFARMTALRVEEEALAPGSIEAARVESEARIVKQAYEAGERVVNKFEPALMLALLKSMMRDPRDQKSVELFLWTTTEDLAKSSMSALQTIDRTMPRIRRPGIAIDVSKARDAIAMVSNTFNGCALP